MNKTRRWKRRQRRFICRWMVLLNRLADMVDDDRVEDANRMLTQELKHMLGHPNVAFYAALLPGSRVRRIPEHFVLPPPGWIRFD